MAASVGGCTPVQGITLTAINGLEVSLDYKIREVKERSTCGQVGEACQRSLRFLRMGLGGKFQHLPGTFAVIVWVREYLWLGIGHWALRTSLHPEPQNAELAGRFP